MFRRVTRQSPFWPAAALLALLAAPHTLLAQDARPTVRADVTNGTAKPVEIALVRPDGKDLGPARSVQPGKLYQTRNRSLPGRSARGYKWVVRDPDTGRVLKEVPADRAHQSIQVNEVRAEVGPKVNVKPITVKPVETGPKIVVSIQNQKVIATADQLPANPVMVKLLVDKAIDPTGVIQLRQGPVGGQTLKDCFNSLPTAPPAVEWRERNKLVAKSGEGKAFVPGSEVQMEKIENRPPPGTSRVTVSHFVNGKQQGPQREVFVNKEQLKRLIRQGN
jgi:hypothetical protein